MGLTQNAGCPTLGVGGAMRAVLPVVLYGVLSIAGCSSGGGGSGGPPPQFLPAALRGQTIPATAATYQISLASANGRP